MCYCINLIEHCGPSRFRLWNILRVAGVNAVNERDNTALTTRFDQDSHDRRVLLFLLSAVNQAKTSFLGRSISR